MVTNLYRYGNRILVNNVNHMPPKVLTGINCCCQDLAESTTSEEVIPPLSSKIGSFTVTNGQSLGTVAINDVGFEPKVVLFFWSPVNLDRIAFGASTGGSNNFHSCIYSSDSDNKSARSCDHSSCFAGVHSDGSGHFVALKVDSLDSNGFTYDLTISPAADYTIYYMALGGSSITHATTGTFDVPASTGNESYTGVGFQPDLMMFVSSNAGATLGTWIHAYQMFGMANADLEESAATTGCDSGVNPTKGATRTSMTSCWLRCDADGVQESKANIVSMDSDGWTLNVTDAPPITQRGVYLALKGDFLSKIDYVQSPNNVTGNQAKTGVGFEPEVLMFQSAMKNPVLDSAHQDAARGMGIANLNGEEASFGYFRDDNRIGYDAYSRQNNALIIDSFDHNGSTREQAEFVSMDSDGFTINWTIAESAQRYNPFLALAPGPS